MPNSRKDTLEAFAIAITERAKKVDDVDEVLNVVKLRRVSAVSVVDRDRFRP